MKRTAEETAEALRDLQIQASKRSTCNHKYKLTPESTVYLRCPKCSDITLNDI